MSLGRAEKWTSVSPWPTEDGRIKPDIVAPGEITSASGAALSKDGTRRDNQPANHARHIINK
jgi:hypothetical protein